MSCAWFGIYPTLTTPKPDTLALLIINVPPYITIPLCYDCLLALTKQPDKSLGRIKSAKKSSKAMSFICPPSWISTRYMLVSNLEPQMILLVIHSSLPLNYQPPTELPTELPTDSRHICLPGIFKIYVWHMQHRHIDSHIQHNTWLTYLEYIEYVGTYAAFAYVITYFTFCGHKRCRIGRNHLQSPHIYHNCITIKVF